MNFAIDDAYWMGIVDQVAKASTCRVQVGCVIVNEKRIVGMGYVGSISKDVHCIDAGCLYVETGNQGSSDTGKSCIRTLHAEMNAIIKCTERDHYMEAYCTYQPCLSCFKCLLAIGVKKIVYKKEYKDVWRDDYVIALKSGQFEQNIGNSIIVYKHA